MPTTTATTIAPPAARRGADDRATRQPAPPRPRHRRLGERTILSGRISGHWWGDGATTVPGLTPQQFSCPQCPRRPVGVRPDSFAAASRYGGARWETSWIARPD